MAKAAKKGAKKTAKIGAKKGSGKRTLVAPKGDKRYVRRDNKGRFNEVDDQRKSLSRDKKRAAKKKAKPGQGDRGDR